MGPNLLQMQKSQITTLGCRSVARRCSHLDHCLVNGGCFAGSGTLLPGSKHFRLFPCSRRLHLQTQLRCMAQLCSGFLLGLRAYSASWQQPHNLPHVMDTSLISIVAMH